MDKLCPAALLLIFTLLPATQSQAEVSVLGFVAARGTLSDAPRSWTEGALGRLLDGEGDGEFSAGLGLEARVLIEASSGLDWSAKLHLGARQDSNSVGRNLGVVEAFVERRWFGDGQRWQLRAGQFFLPVSRENVEALWVNPYTLTHSALNSWIGEEIRPVGIDFSWRRELESGARVDLGVTVFGQNDSSGALLAWRGFAWHDRLSLYGETLPLAPLDSLNDPAIFGDQNDAGTKPFGSDLDGRPGYALRARWSDGLRNWLLTAVDTRGDLGLHSGEYAWHTRFLLAGFDHNAVGQGWGYAAEAMGGDSRMGIVGRPMAHIRFYTAYLLASYGADPWRYSVRAEGFDIDDIDQTIAENNEEQGYALTLAAIRYLGQWRLGLEYLYIDGERTGAADLLLDRQTGGQQLKFEVRYEF